MKVFRKGQSVVWPNGQDGFKHGTVSSVSKLYRQCGVRWENGNVGNVFMENMAPTECGKAWEVFL